MNVLCCAALYSAALCHACYADPHCALLYCAGLHGAVMRSA